MDSSKFEFRNTDEYIAGFPEPVRIQLEKLRSAIQLAAPSATEVISYNMPAFKGNKVLVYFAAYKNHIGFYPTSKPMVVFEDRMREFKTSKGAVQFPLDRDMPLDLITDMVKFRLKEDAFALSKSKK